MVAYGRPRSIWPHFEHIFGNRYGTIVVVVVVPFLFDRICSGPLCLLCGLFELLWLLCFVDALYIVCHMPLNHLDKFCYILTTREVGTETYASTDNAQLKKRMKKKEEK